MPNENENERIRKMLIDATNGFIELQTNAFKRCSPEECKFENKITEKNKKVKYNGATVELVEEDKKEV